MKIDRLLAIVLLLLNRRKVTAYELAEQITRLGDGTRLVRASMPMGDWIIGWLLSFGEHVEVVKPVHVREIIKEKLKALGKLYGAV